jgi:ribosomal protein S18 acetylase RimI-like enzyme
VAVCVDMLDRTVGPRQIPLDALVLAPGIGKIILLSFTNQLRECEQEDCPLRRVWIVGTNPDHIRVLRRFMLDAWKRAGPGALGWTGATEETIHEISSEKYLEQLVSSPKMKFFLAEEDGEAVGFAANRIQNDFTVELAGIIVREDLFSKGIGSLLLSECVRSARGAGFTSMVAKTETSNERAISFYTKKGFARAADTVEMVENSKLELAVLKLAL